MGTDGWSGPGGHRRLAAVRFASSKDRTRTPRPFDHRVRRLGSRSSGAVRNDLGVVRRVVLGCRRPERNSQPLPPVTSPRRRQGAWWAPRSSKPVCGRKLAGGFDSRPPPPTRAPRFWASAPCRIDQSSVDTPVELRLRTAGPAGRPTGRVICSPRSFSNKTRRFVKSAGDPLPPNCSRRKLR